MKKNSKPFAHSNKRKRARLARHGATCLAGASMLLGGAAAAPAHIDLLEMPLEGLMQMKITSVSKKEEKLSDAASAIFVITQDDIRRSGVTSIPEALRLSPGLEVARQDSHTWAISSRGFNDEFANQLLVLIDGRSVYTPLFAGVYWDVQDLMLEDIDRIEVIRGPGGTLWGANAVNGVINITTKSAKETQGILLSGGVGSEEVGFGARYGAKLHENGYLRVYGKWFNRDESVLPTGAEANDAWTMYRGGFRYDYLPSMQNAFTLQGDIYQGTLDQTVLQADPTLLSTIPIPNSDDVDVSGANVLGKWVHSFSDTSELALKVYFDHTWRDRVVFAETRNTFDIDLQHHLQLGSRNDIVWGVGYNVTGDDLDNRFTVSFNPDDRVAHLYSAFVQDEFSLIPDKLSLTVGTKVEHNDYTGWEFQPSARLSYNLATNQTLWLAASRAISTPSRAEHNIRINQQVFAPGVLVSQFGSSAMRSKELVGFELGYRLQVAKWFTTDIATFYNIYDKQRSLEAGAPFPEGGYFVAPFTIDNLLEGETYGFEIANTIQATDWWRIRVNYSFLKIQLHKEAGSTDMFLEAAEHDSPVHQVGIRSQMDLPMDFELDGGMRYVDGLSNPMRNVPSYVVGDIRLGWRSPKRHWEISVTGQNLFDTHKEFSPSYIQTQVTEVETSVFAKVTYSY